MKIIDTIEGLHARIRIQFDRDLDEYQVKAFSYAKQRWVEDCTYYTDDRDDARDTAIAMSLAYTDQREHDVTGYINDGNYIQTSEV
jgi:hypothetical protein